MVEIGRATVNAGNAAANFSTIEAQDENQMVDIGHLPTTSRVASCTVIC
jgi:hypothetical protein